MNGTELTTVGPSSQGGLNPACGAEPHGARRPHEPVCTTKLTPATKLTNAEAAELAFIEAAVQRGIRNAEAAYRELVVRGGWRFLDLDDDAAEAFRRMEGR